MLFEDKPFADIDWLRPIIESHGSDKTGLMRIAIEIACYSAANGGGPFGALIADTDGNIIECGCNEVIHRHDSTAHAEIVTLRRAQSSLKTHDLSSKSLVLYTSCAPCIQCFGAIYWSGLRSVIAGASKDDAQAVGFDEGEISPTMWKNAREKKGIIYELEFLRNEAQAPFAIYKDMQGVVY